MYILTPKNKNLNLKSNYPKNLILIVYFLVLYFFITNFFSNLKLRNFLIDFKLDQKKNSLYIRQGTLFSDLSNLKEGDEIFFLYDGREKKANIINNNIKNKNVLASIQTEKFLNSNLTNVFQTEIDYKLILSKIIFDIKIMRINMFHFVTIFFSIICFIFFDLFFSKRKIEIELTNDYYKKYFFSILNKILFLNLMFSLFILIDKNILMYFYLMFCFYVVDKYYDDPLMYIYIVLLSYLTYYYLENLFFYLINTEGEVSLFEVAFILLSMLNIYKLLCN
ncbi:hypothetical protein ['Cynodon dactylon' phytoplasma]|uniref:hypothetical protein n=1 Tax='Cynodon dactylon' phytoplasma TaxID=295320 RepID=UPI001265C8F6|nr:hypothetical protein ['Cynodon dactylon' phytoplasma]KAB8121857.1 hypothetical protein F1741_01215 ['Cynodon dactylon' phytoplasma]